MDQQNPDTAGNSVMKRVVATHMMIRVALTGVALAIAASVVVERIDDTCTLTSISAYWYTDARAIFAGGLIAISICLVAYSGGTWTENLLLNLAGILAPIVSLAPTQVGKARDVACLGDRAPQAYDSEATTHGLWVYFGVLAAGAVVTIVASRAMRRGLLVGRQQSTLSPAQRWAWRVGIAAAFLVPGALLVWWVVDDKFPQHAHFPSAATMFVFLAFVAASRTEWGSRKTAKWDLYRDTPTLPSVLRARRRFNYGRLYGFVAIGMLATLGLAGLNIKLESWANGWDFGVIAAEFVLLGLFLLFWAAQTIQMRDLTNFESSADDDDQQPTGVPEGSTASEPPTEVLA